MNNLDKQYLDLLQDILDNGTKKVDRTGTGTISVFGRQIRHKMSDGFPLLTTKRVAFSQVKSELAWFLAGSSDIRVLWKSNNHIWDGDWYKKYYKSCSTPYSLEEMVKFGLEGGSHFHESIWDLGPIYGKQWKSWRTGKSVVVGHNGRNNEFGEIVIDQIQNILDDLVNNPDSRRMIVSAWNVGEIDQMTLPPCHNFFQVYTKELEQKERIKLIQKVWKNKEILPESEEVSSFWIKYEELMDKYNIPKRAISLMWNQRSVDTPLGLPFNIASYGTLLEMLAQEVNMVPDELIGNLGDVHIYLNQIEGVKEQLTRESRPLPTIQLQDGMYCQLTGDSQDVVIKDYNPHPRIDFPLSN